MVFFCCFSAFVFANVLSRLFFFFFLPRVSIRFDLKRCTFICLFRPIEDYNEVPSHFIECIYVHFYNNRAVVGPLFSICHGIAFLLIFDNWLTYSDDIPFLFTETSKCQSSATCDRFYESGMAGTKQ